MTKEKIIVLPENNRTFGIDEKFLTEDDLEFLREFAKYLKSNNIKPNVEVSVVSKDKHGIVNRINIYIDAGDFRVVFKNVYCGGVLGSDRIFEVLYHLEYLFEELIGERFDHYADYSISRNYRML